MRHYVDLYAVRPRTRQGLDGNVKSIAFNDFYHVDGLKLGTVQSFGRLPAALVEARKRREGEMAPHAEPAVSDPATSDPAISKALPADAAAAERTVDASAPSGEARLEQPVGAPLRPPQGVETDPADSLQIPLF